LGYTFQYGQVFDRFPEFLSGALLTIRLSAFAMVLGLAIGIVCAVTRVWGPKLAALLVGSYIEFIRNTPFLIQLFFVFFALPHFGVRLDPNTAALAAMTINLGAYATEIVRAGLEAVPSGQIDAGRALGFKRLQIVRFLVIFPALKAVYPSLTSQFVLLLLGSSIISAIAADDLTGVANTVNMQTFRSFEIYSIVAAMYVAMALGFKAMFAGIYQLVFARRG
jgi:polar amino acid transport system permease protein